MSGQRDDPQLKDDKDLCLPFGIKTELHPAVQPESGSGRISIWSNEKILKVATAHEISPFRQEIWQRSYPQINVCAQSHIRA